MDVVQWEEFISECYLVLRATREPVEMLGTVYQVGGGRSHTSVGHILREFRFCCCFPVAILSNSSCSRCCLFPPSFLLAVIRRWRNSFNSHARSNSLSRSMGERGGRKPGKLFKVSFLTDSCRVSGFPPIFPDPEEFICCILFAGI